MAIKELEQINKLVDRLGLSDEPLGLFYTDERPAEGISPKPGELPTREREAAGEVDWGAVFGNFTCTMGCIWRARKKNRPAFFSAKEFGCMGGAFYLGFLKPQAETIIHYVSTGIPGAMEGECYIDSPDAFRSILEMMDPRPAPAEYAVIKPLSLFEAGEVPETVTCFARPEVMSGLNQLAVFVANDPEIVVNPWGAGCTSLMTWPLHYRAKGITKAVLGGWDPSARKFFKTDELYMTCSYDLFLTMAERWEESFLTKEVWDLVLKKADRSARAWGEK